MRLRSICAGIVAGVAAILTSAGVAQANDCPTSCLVPQPIADGLGGAASGVGGAASGVGGAASGVGGAASGTGANLGQGGSILDLLVGRPCQACGIK
jgi:hypothetical protein